MVVVSDLYDFFNVIDNIWGEELKVKVEVNGGIFVICFDSGDFVLIVM